MPGDVKWLETYAEKEKQISSANLMENFYSKVVGSQKPVEEHSERQEDASGDSKTSDHAESQNLIANGISVRILSSCEKTKQLETVLEHQESSEINSFGDQMDKEQTEMRRRVSEDQPAVHAQEHCCFLTPVTCPDNAQTASLHTEPENQGITSMPVDASPRCRATSSGPIPMESISEEDDVAISDHEEVSDADEQRLDRRNGILQEEPRPSVSSSAAALDNAGSETLLRVMRKRDKDQAEALILEGRVQMLVVQTQNNVYQCDHCSYVTRKQAALERHCRSSCHVVKAALQCHDCGLCFKQLRSFNTHRLRKCHALQRKKKVFSAVKTLEKTRDDESAQDQDEVHNMNEAGSSSVTVTDGYVDNVQKSALANEEKNANHVSGPSKSPDLTPHEFCGYREDNGKFTCKICSFSCGRKATIDRHCAACSKGASKRKLPLNEPRDEHSESDCEQEEQHGENAEGDLGGKIKTTKRFSCSDCPFICQQRRALKSHERRGCLKSGEVQCQQCSFVARSEKSLNQHVLVHSKDKDIKRGKRACLQCKLCTFTCKQERCMAQHVALKHEGARPFSCRFCDFSTARRHRLDAHESMHTGVGRHCCELCGQTFGTSSKLRLHRQRIHERQATHFCSLCDYKGYNPTDISRHTLSCHTGELSHSCSQCEARFSSDIALKQHCKRTHQADSSQRCALCSFTCNSKAALKAHVRRDHSPKEDSTSQENPDSQLVLEKPRKAFLSHKCPDCSFTTGKRLQLVQHIMDKHEGGDEEDKNLKCDICGFSCSHQLVFDQHIRSHGGTCLYKCNECDFSTRNRQKITWHMRIHTGEKPYHCEKCSYTCADPSRLKVRNVMDILFIKTCSTVIFMKLQSTLFEWHNQ